VAMDIVEKKEETFKGSNLELSGFHAYAGKISNSIVVGNVSDKIR
jgi:hypothetical protein